MDKIWKSLFTLLCLFTMPLGVQAANHHAAFDCEVALPTATVASSQPVSVVQNQEPDTVVTTGQWVTETYMVQTGCINGQCQFEQRTRQVWRPGLVVNRVAKAIAKVTDAPPRTRTTTTIKHPTTTYYQVVPEVTARRVYHQTCPSISNTVVYADGVCPRCGRPYCNTQSSFRSTQNFNYSSTVHQPLGTTLRGHLRRDHGIDTRGMSYNQMLQLHTRLH